MIMDAAQEETIYTIGHSTHNIENFVVLLKRYGINAVADVRSVPYSRWQPQFNREELKAALKSRGIAYVFLGAELGARSDDPGCYKNGRVMYRLVAKTPLFMSGIERVRDGSRRRRVILMCAEKEPLDCHRTILVARKLVEDGVDVVHVLANGEVESHSAAMKRLFERLDFPEQDLFCTVEELLDQAYAAQERRIAYVDEVRVREAQEAK